MCHIDPHWGLISGVAVVSSWFDPDPMLSFNQLFFQRPSPLHFQLLGVGKSVAFSSLSRLWIWALFSYIPACKPTSSLLIPFLPRAGFSWSYSVVLSMSLFVFSSSAFALHLTSFFHQFHTSRISLSSAEGAKLSPDLSFGPVTISSKHFLWGFQRLFLFFYWTVFFITCLVFYFSSF